VFTMKGPPPGFTDVGDISRVYTELETNDTLSYQRVNTALPFPLVADVYQFVFRGFGVNNVSATPQDWLDPITAPVDTLRISVLHDRVTAIRSGNDSGVAQSHKRWHPLRKTIHYADQEIGGSIAPSPFSVTTKPGAGDMYIMDIIVGNSDDPTDRLDFLPTSTLYWHEK